MNEQQRFAILHPLARADMPTAPYARRDREWAVMVTVNK